MSTELVNVKTNFERFVNKTKSCWMWTGAIRNGYGAFSTRNPKKVHKANRFAWQLYRGEIPEGLCVLHICDVRICVNPDHLWLGTHQDNMDDRQRKGRTARGDRSGARTHPERHARGEQSGQAKLTAEQVREIRKLHTEKIRNASIARRYGVTKQQVGNIVYGKQWAGVI